MTPPEVVCSACGSPLTDDHARTCLAWMNRRWAGVEVVVIAVTFAIALLVLR